MDFLDNSVLPQSAQHLELLKYLLVLAYLLLIPYLSALFGSVIFSVLLSRKGEKLKNTDYLKLSKSMIDLLTFNKSVSLGLGIVPFLSIIFSYAQLLHNSGAVVIIGLFVSLIFFVAGIIITYTYKHSFHLKDLLSMQHLNNEALEYRIKTSKLYYITGIWSIVTLALSSYLLVGSVQLALDPARWESASFLGIIFSFSTIFYFIYFIALAIAFTMGAMLYHLKSIDKEKKFGKEFTYSANKYLNSSGLLFSVIIPVFITITILLTPFEALSGYAVWAGVALMLIILLISSYFYVMLKEGDWRYSSWVFYLFIIAFIFSIVKDQFNFDISSKRQVKILANNYLDYQNKLKEEMGIALVEISGADIYNGRCIACHQFDQKMVGPPYNAILPKYEGKQEELIKFILSPVKVDPNYPPMPNQGLKPKEAQAVADYIVQIYKEQNQ